MAAARAPTRDSKEAARPAAQQEAPAEEEVMCSDCVDAQNPQAAKIYCAKCDQCYCIEHDAFFHTGERKKHPRDPISKRPAQCSTHNVVATAFCMRDKRFACLQCTSSAPEVGPCSAHHRDVKTLDEAAALARAALDSLVQGFTTDEAALQREFDELAQLHAAEDERLAQLRAGQRRAAEGRAKVAATASQEPPKLLAELMSAETKAAELRAEMKAAVGDVKVWRAKWQAICSTAAPWAVGIFFFFFFKFFYSYKYIEECVFCGARGRSGLLLGLRSRMHVHGDCGVPSGGRFGGPVILFRNSLLAA
jgi:hypothetical protein